MLAITEIVPKPRDYDFWTNHAQANFQCLQAYLVPIERYCRDTWSVLDLKLQAYLVHFEIRLHPY